LSTTRVALPTRSSRASCLQRYRCLRVESTDSGWTMRRSARLTNASSKKVENPRAAVAPHFAHYNFVRIHGKLRVTPAMAARVTDRLWSLEELVAQTSG
jgi:hypothetical protein